MRRPEGARCPHVQQLTVGTCCAVILYRDASANKGGVTSSSLEVLAGMALNDEEYLSLMCSPPGQGELDPTGVP